MIFEVFQEPDVWSYFGLTMTAALASAHFSMKIAHYSKNGIKNNSKKELEGRGIQDKVLDIDINDAQKTIEMQSYSHVENNPYI